MKKRGIGLFTALMLLAGVCAAGPLNSGAAPAPVDLDKDCSLIVKPALPTESQESENYWKDMQTAKVALDLYKVAGVTKVSGYDTYTFDPVGEYGELNISDYSDLQAMDAAAWEAKAQDAAKITLLDETSKPVTTVDITGATVTEVKAELKDLRPGLYLVIARGEDLSERSDYIKIIGEELTTGLGETEINHSPEKLVTIANSDRYEYAFTPQLIALPTKPEDANGVINTANPGEWAYNREVFLKQERNQRYGDLEIVKTLREHQAMVDSIRKEPVTFIFHVTAMLDNEKVYDEVDSITFSEAGEKTTLLTGIPATAQVTVSEVYTGISYTQVVPANNGNVTGTITADGVIQAEFENEYNDREVHGHGIKNQFVYNEATNGWEWSADPAQGGSSSPDQPGGEEAE